VVANHESLAQMLMGKSRILLYDVHTRIAPNINLLTQIGVPKTLISSMLLRCPNVICDNHAEFSRSVELAIGMEFNPVKYLFIAAIKVLTELSTTTWDRKVMAFKSWGFSDKEVGMAFRKSPLTMNLSEEKLSKIMDIFVNEMGRKPAEVARYANILNYSFENRIKPRCRVIKVLISEGLLRKTILLQTFLHMKELQFLEKFVSKYKDEVPHLLNIYQERQIV
jgi:mTERF domain-containing protein